MSLNQLKAAVGQQQQQPGTVNFPALLKRSLSEIGRALPSHLPADRMARVALTCFRQNEQLTKCDPHSIVASVVVLSQLGLEPGVLGQAFLVPYRNTKANRLECQPIPGWRGFVKLVQHSRRAFPSTAAVYEGDTFDWRKGTRAYIDHQELALESDPTKLTHVYAQANIVDARNDPFEVWSAKKVAHHRDRYNRVGKAHYSFNHWEMYARKIALLQVVKYCPISVEIELRAQAVHDLEYRTQAGPVRMDLNTLSDALDEKYSFPAETISDEKEDKASLPEFVSTEAESKPTLPAPDKSEQPLTDKELRKDMATGWIKYIRAAKTEPERLEIFKECAAAYRKIGATVPLEVEAVAHDKKEALQQEK